jgi:hypothetical protein
MIIFTLIFFAMLIVVGVSAVVAFSFYLKRRTKSLESNNQTQLKEVPPYRSLFEPDDEEVRASEREAQMKFEAESEEAEQKILFERATRGREFEKTWRMRPTKQNTVELLRLAAESESADLFSQTAENMIQVWRENKIENLTSKDLADLLDSHFRLLPQQERTSGALFWLKREIKNLREKSEESK